MRRDPVFSPREVWRQKIGGIQSRNTFVSDGSRLFVGTCGDAWNVRDRHDGVYCLNRSDGAVLWFTPTTADVNEICLAGLHLLAPTDAGDLFVLEASSGRIVEVFRADSAVLGKPMVTQGNGAWSAIFASISGSIYRIEEHGNALNKLGEICGGLRASLVPLGSDQFIAATESGTLVKATVQKDKLSSRQLGTPPPDTEWGGEVSLTAAPLLARKRLFVGYSRITYSQSPGVFCFNLNEERIEWVAGTGQSPTPNFGNVRTTPALIGDRVIVASAYSDGVDLLDARNGRFLQRVTLGQNVFQQWSSPAPIGEKRVALGRVDGVCSIVDVESGLLASSISLVTAETEHLAKLNRGIPFSSADFALYPGEPAPTGAICGTPLIDREMLFVGTTDGVVAGVRLNAGFAQF